jgi:hypothetical protein
MTLLERIQEILEEITPAQVMLVRHCQGAPSYMYDTKERLVELLKALEARLRDELLCPVCTGERYKCSCEEHNL